MKQGKASAKAEAFSRYRKAYPNSFLIRTVISDNKEGYRQKNK